MDEESSNFSDAPVEETDDMLAEEELNADEIQIPDSSGWNPDDITTDYRNTGTFFEVYDELYPRLYRHTVYEIGRLGLPANLVTDVLQTAMGKAHKNWHKYTQGTYALGWLKKIITNTAYNERRKAKNEPVTYGDMSIVMTGPSYHARSAESIVIEEASFDEIRAAFREVPEPFREVLNLVYLEEMPFAAVAEKLHIPLGTALTRGHRGRKLLREILLSKWKDKEI